MSALDQVVDAESEVVELVAELIRRNSENWGESSDTVGEADVADFIAEKLREVGWSPEVITTTSDKRRAVALRVPGSDSAAPVMLVHGHIDVVPAMSADWSRDPYAGVIDDGMLFGRGAVDMKDMDGMLLALLRHWGRTGQRPRRTLQILFTPDEEAGGKHGAHWLVANRPDLFEGCTEAVGEVGGFSITVRDDLRLYPIQTAEKGIRWLRLTASGRAGHGSMINDDNAVTQLCEAVTKVGQHRWPVRLTPTVEKFLAELSDAYGVPIDPADMDEVFAKLGTLGSLVGATLQNTANPTMLDAGYKHNVIPQEAQAFIDGRVLPGYEDEFEAEVQRIVGDQISVHYDIKDIALETSFDGPTVDAMAAALRAEDSGARPVPYMISGGTDAKAFSTLGIRCYGFSPLRLPPGLDYWQLFHGVDERVPVDALQFGVRVLKRFFDAA
jgi:acetylornithine deacetylase/succinyl-diaminopimelate desuccinylase-like protein